jgi:hypothetical protein
MRAVEGLPGLILAVAVFFFIPTHPHTYRWLTPRQREVAVARLQSESVDEGGKTGIDWSAVVHAFKDWKVYVIALMYSAMNVNLSSIGQSLAKLVDAADGVGGFLPTIIRGLGYTAAQVRSNSV